VYRILQNPNKIDINKTMNELKQMKQKDIKPMKEKLWKENNKICPLLGIEVELDKMALDHIHKLVAEEPSEQKGTIRNAIEFRANAIEGKITNNWKRYFGADESKHPIDLPSFLRNLADYLEAGAYQDENGDYYIHPSEAPKVKKLSKRNYNKLAKEYKLSGRKKKFPEFPKSGKLTVALKALFEEFKIEPYN
jgi:hypothetical protein